MATERWENEGGQTLTKYAIARFVRAFQSRLETDPLGDVSVPAFALYAAQTQAVQTGSSIMPGKVNPVMAEMLNMVCFHILGHGRRRAGGLA